MLILARKTGERIRIRVADADVWVQVTEVTGGRVRLGIEAPASAHIVREELLPFADQFANTK